MVYIGRDGTISQREPWNVRLWRMFVRFFQAIYFLYVNFIQPYDLLESSELRFCIFLAF